MEQEVVEIKQEEELSEEEQAEYNLLRKQFCEKRPPTNRPTRGRQADKSGAPQRPYILSLGASRRVSEPALRKLNTWHRTDMHKSALVLLRGLSDYIKKSHINAAVPGILREEENREVSETYTIDLTGDDDEVLGDQTGLKLRSTINLETYIITEFELAEILKPKIEPPHVEALD